MITQTEIKRLFEYREGKLFWKINKRGISKGKHAGYIHNNGYRRIIINRKMYLEHQLVWLYFHGNIPKQLEHKNRIRNDNKIENLRESNQSQNIANATKVKTMNGKPTSSKYKGVTQRKGKKNWRGSITKNGERIDLGTFKHEIDCAKAYDQKAIELFGEFANTNFTPVEEE